MWLRFPQATRSFIPRRKRLPVARLVLWLSRCMLECSHFGTMFRFHSGFLVFFFKDGGKKERNVVKSFS